MANGAAAAAGQMAEAIKASGAIVIVKPDVFLSLVTQVKEPLVVAATSKFLSTSYKYLTSYKGLFFYTRSREPLQLPGSAEIIAAKRIIVPGETA